MRIVISDWSKGSLLEKLKYTHGQKIEGTEDDALVIVSELFKLGKNVMIRHRKKDIFISVYDRSFQQR
jgi:hypothetical protein